MSRLKKIADTQVKGKLKEKFGIANPMQLPRLRAIVLSMGIAEAAKDKNIIADHLIELTWISGQKAVPTKARTSISNFKLREGQTIGAKSTLRGVKMWDFLDRFINVICARIKDFRGFPTKLDGRGNYSLGLSEQQIFPELNLDDVKRTQGMNITFVIEVPPSKNHSKDDIAREFLRLLGMPFKDLPVEITI